MLTYVYTDVYLFMKVFRIVVETLDSTERGQVASRS